MEVITHSTDFNEEIPIVKKRGTNVSYYNIPSAFDIETSSFYDNGEKRATMYLWGFGLGNKIITGRTWNDFLKLINYLSAYYDLSENKRIIIYVHNLSYEFQFIRKRFRWANVFATEERKVVYALSENGIEFRCSYLLSGYSLAKVGENLRNHVVRKHVGDLDYKLIRHSKTPIADTELGYQIGDIEVVLSYIDEEIERNGDITKIPLTKTGYVRKLCRKNCYNGVNTSKNERQDVYKKYRRMMNELTLSGIDYIQLKRAFAGGYTHANVFNSCKIFENVQSMDFTSSYPYVMVSEKFPMSYPEYVTIKTQKEFDDNLNKYCCIFDAEFSGIQQCYWADSYISASKCGLTEKAVLNNGRIVRADKLRITITEQDYMIIKKVYQWDSMRITNFNRFKKDYLPRDLVLSILSLYRDKTILKGVRGKETEYLGSKEMCNSVYGMMVTDIVRDEYIYDNDSWEKSIPELYEAICAYNKSGNRFLYYPWGVWVTAYARKNLWSAILELGNDYIYSDTDSVKYVNPEKHKLWFEQYNNFVIRKLSKMCEKQNIPFELTAPKTIKGVVKQLGVWEDEGIYRRFKTLGAKRYIIEDQHGDISITVSGVNKHTAVPYLIKKYGVNIFEHFTNGLYIPRGVSGKNILTYIDDEYSGTVTDYLGNIGEYHEYSGIHMEEGEYTLSIGQEYIDYMKGVRMLQ